MNGGKNKALMQYDVGTIEKMLRDLLSQGMDLGAAIRELHYRNGVGLMFLWPAVAVILNVERREAMAVVVKEVNRKQNGQQTP